MKVFDLKPGAVKLTFIYDREGVLQYVEVMVGPNEVRLQLETACVLAALLAQELGL